MNTIKIALNSQALIHITDAHISPGPFQLMSCKLAMQLFNNRVVTATKTCIMADQLKSQAASPTAKMIKKPNNLKNK